LEIKLARNEVIKMKYVGYAICGFIVFWVVEFLAINVAEAIGSGPGQIGVVVTAIAVMCSIIVICTFVIVDAINGIQ
jgi:cation transporter-like permease